MTSGPGRPPHSITLAITTKALSHLPVCSCLQRPGAHGTAAGPHVRTSLLRAPPMMHVLRAPAGRCWCQYARACSRNQTIMALAPCRALALAPAPLQGGPAAWRQAALGPLHRAHKWATGMAETPQVRGHGQWRLNGVGGWGGGRLRDACRHVGLRTGIVAFTAHRQTGCSCSGHDRWCTPGGALQVVH